MGANQSAEVINKYNFGSESLIVDASFNIENNESYHLAFQIGLQGISFSVLDIQNNKYLVLYNNPSTSMNADVLNDKLLKLKEENDLLKVPYKSAKFILINDQSTIVPTALYEPSREAKYLNFNLNVSIKESSDKQIIKRDKLHSLDAYNIYRMPKKLFETMVAFSENVQVLHFASSLIETLLNNNKNQNKSFCILNFEKGLFTMIVVEGNNLKFCNSFSYGTKEDLAYYVLFVFEQLKLNPEKIDLQIMGEIERKSEDFSFLHQYIRNINFVNRNTEFKYSYHIEELPGHFHYNLFSQYHCG